MDAARTSAAVSTEHPSVSVVIVRRHRLVVAFRFRSSTQPTLQMLYWRSPYNTRAGVRVCVRACEWTTSVWAE